jgi:hypothetical protein
MSGAYRERPDAPRRVVRHEPFPRSAAMLFVVQLLLMAGGLVSTTLSRGHRATMDCDHRGERCDVQLDDQKSTTVKVSDVVEARVVSEPLSKGALARLGLFHRDGSTTMVGSVPHAPEVVAEQARQVGAFLADPKAPSLYLTIDAESVRPSSTTFVLVALILLVPLALLLALRRSARVEYEQHERSLRIVRRRGPFTLRSTRLRLDEVKSAVLERKHGARLAYRVVLERKTGERVPLVDGWSPHEGAQKRTIATIEGWLAEATS